jgi:glycosyltransferase involved in cell wall biosynthesis
VRVVWSLPVRGEPLTSSRGDLVRARALIEALREEGHRVTVVQDGSDRAARARVSTYRRVVRPLFPHRLATGMRDVARVLHGRAHGRRVATAAIGEGADLIVETQVHFAGSGALASRLTGVPLLLDDCSPSSEEGELGSVIPGLARRVFRGQARAAAALTASSPQIRDLVVEAGAPPGRVHVVPNGVDAAAFLRIDRAEARKRMGFGREVVVAFVGSFQPWHRADLLLEALRHRPGLGLHLLLVGEGPGRSTVLARAEALGLRHRITAPGPLHGEDLARALTASDIGALPSSNEYGQPMKLLDYAAAGLAIVAADVPPVRAMIEPGVTGLLVPAGDAAAMSAAFGTLAEVPVARMCLGKTARERLAAPATWAVRARALVDAAAAERPARRLPGIAGRIPPVSRVRRPALPPRTLPVAAGGRALARRDALPTPRR